MSALGFLTTSVPLRLASSGSVVAIPILAVQELGDVAVGGALVAASLAPAVLAAPIVGVALDRARHPRRLVVASALVTVVGFAAAALIGTLPLPIIAVLLVAAGFAAPFYMGGLSSFVTDEIADERRAYAYDALAYNIASVAGPGIVAIAAVGGSARLAMWLMAGIALLGSVGALALGMRSRPVTTERVRDTIAAGARQLVRHRPLTVVIVSGTVSQFGAGALPIAALAVSLERTGAAADAALIVTAFALGGLLGALLATARPSNRFSPQAVMGAGSVAIGLLTLVAAPNLGFVWTLVALGLSGLFTASNSASLLLLRKQQSPLGVRSQVFTIGSGLRAMSGALGAFVAGLIAGLPAELLLAGIGLVWLLSAALMLAYPRGAQPLPEPAPAAAL